MNIRLPRRDDQREGCQQRQQEPENRLYKMDTTRGALSPCEGRRFIDFILEKDYVMISMLVVNNEIY